MVFYLARPCQFIGPPLPDNCRVNIWTQDRFSPVVIDAMSEALNQIVLRYPRVQLDLVGYSGGGNIAALLAERRSDVRSLRTVAGNLDVAYVNAIHHVTPMPTAENAIDSCSRASRPAADPLQWRGRHHRAACCRPTFSTGSGGEVRANGSGQRNGAWFGLGGSLAGITGTGGAGVLKCEATLNDVRTKQ
ncbi:Uncharacterised protein [Leclercia adecarboxylata]|uniref:Alpha/beta hydrolase family n=1 Tax=Leclercia adecarboxylata TaxID=83655 RepID=A0A4U9ILP5_9ENTR|nr:Uncharacterised protein [Leclercia adecarboxylata]